MTQHLTAMVKQSLDNSYSTGVLPAAPDPNPLPNHHHPLTTSNSFPHIMKPQNPEYVPPFSISPKGAMGGQVQEGRALGGEAVGDGRVKRGILKKSTQSLERQNSQMKSGVSIENQQQKVSGHKKHLSFKQPLKSDFDNATSSIQHSLLLKNSLVSKQSKQDKRSRVPTAGP